MIPAHTLLHIASRRRGEKARFENVPHGSIVKVGTSILYADRPEGSKRLTLWLARARFNGEPGATGFTYDLDTVKDETCQILMRPHEVPSPPPAHEYTVCPFIQPNGSSHLVYFDGLNAVKHEIMGNMQMLSAWISVMRGRRGYILTEPLELACPWCAGQRKQEAGDVATETPAQNAYDVVPELRAPERVDAA